MECKICNNKLESLIDFGQMPIANGFLKNNQFDNEFFYKMEVGVCEKCFMFQLLNQPKKEQMFNENYAFYTHTSKNMMDHFSLFSKNVIENYLYDKKNPFVVEIGSNDGSTLLNFKKNNINHLGVEPSKNVAEYAQNQFKINTMNSFFDLQAAEQIISKYEKADLIFATNVFCHIPYIHSIISGVKKLLKKDGIFIFEDPYILDVMQKTSFDQIYDEHYFLFSIQSIKNLFQMHDMEIFKVEKQETHGGSMRYYLSKKKEKKIDPSVEKYYEIEMAYGITDISKYIKFKKNCEEFKHLFREFLYQIKNKNKKISGYAATSKSTTILNYCNIDNTFIDCIYDTTPIKIGKFSPGTHIPIFNHAELSNNYPDYLLLFAYNHAKEIFLKEDNFKKHDGKWITYVPEIKLV